LTLLPVYGVLKMLTFPTIAEQVLAEFENATRTTSISTIAKQRGGCKEIEWPSTIVWRFDDDTSLTITGRGCNHSVEVHLP
jgi:hypothetical protein